MPIKIQDFKNKIIRKIQEKFEVREQKSHHILYEIYYKNKRVLKTFCSHSSSGKDIRNDILSKMKRELKLDKLQQLYDLRDCPMTAEDYFNLLKEKNVVSD